MTTKSHAKVAMRKHSITAGTAAALILGLLAVFAPAAQAVTLPTCPTTTLTKTGTQTSQVNQVDKAATWNLTGAVWDKINSDYPVRSDAVTRGCVNGGTVHGRIPHSATRDQWYNGEDGGTRRGGEAFRQTLTNTAGNYLVLRNSVATDFEDAYDPNGQSASDTYYLDHVRAEWIRDDCIENEGTGTAEKPMNVVIKDSLFDGCFTGLAERPTWSNHGAPNGFGPSSLTIEDSLMWIQPAPLGPNYCNTTKVAQGRCKTTGTKDVWLGAHGIWKWSKAAGKTVTMKNVVFRIDMSSYTGCAPQVWPAGTYQNVKVVWLGSGSYATAGGCKNVLPAGVSVTTDKAVWDNAKAAWLNSPAASLR